MMMIIIKGVPILSIAKFPPKRKGEYPPICHVCHGRCGHMEMCLLWFWKSCEGNLKKGEGRFEVELWLKWNCRKFMNANQRRIRPILGHKSILSSPSLPPLFTICYHSRFPHGRLEEATLLLWTGHPNPDIIVEQIWPLPHFKESIQKK